MKKHYVSDSSKRKLFISASIAITLVSVVIFVFINGCVSSSTPLAETTKPVPAVTVTPVTEAKIEPLPEEGDLLLWQDFEGAISWIADTGIDNDSALDVKQSLLHATSGTHSLKGDFTMNGKNGATFETQSLEKWSDWSEMYGILVDVFNATEEQLRVVLAVKTGPGWTWQESAEHPIVPGDNRDVKISFVDNTMKSAASGWKNNVSLKEAKVIDSVLLKFFGNAGVASSVYIDNIRFILKKSAKTEIAGTEAWELTKNLTLSEKTKQFEGMLEIGAMSDNLKNGRISAYDKLEIGFELKAHVTNPYDPSDISVTAQFSAPGKKTINIPAFYMIPYSEQSKYGRMTFNQSGEGTWNVRFTPVDAGSWSYTLVAEQKGKKTAAKPVAFTVDSKATRGFVRTKKDNRYFVFDSGEVYLPIGSNVCWYRGGSNGFESYETWFKQMSENGANYARIWMATWGFAQEWTETGLGNYNARQGQAAELDALFGLAEKYGMYLMICLINHGQFSTSTNTEWSANPYNSAKGGMCDKPVDFLTNEKAKAFFKQKLRYISSRWGYNTHLFSWEWWNEVDLTDGLSNPTLLAPWMVEMKGYLDSIEPYRHLTTSSWSSPMNGKEDYWTKGILDFAQVHAYNQSDWRDYMVGEAADLLPILQKPLLFGEFGINSENFIDPDGIGFHDGLYSGVFSGAAGTGMIWWWDTYIEPKNLYYHYKGLAEFFKGEEMLLPDTKPVTILDPYENDYHIGAYALSGPKKIFVWVRSNYYYYGYFNDNIIGVGLKNFKLPVVKKAPLDVPVAKPGTYQVEIWDPAKAAMIDRIKVDATDSIEITLPELTKDLLIKIY